MLAVIRKILPECIKEVCRRIRARLLSIGLSHAGPFALPDEEVVSSGDFSVIVPIHDAPEVTKRCLDSIELYSGRAEVILVDDGSRLQETRDLIRDYEHRNAWKVFTHDQPLGHSRACEAGSRLATRRYLCFLNSDTVVTPWSWCGAKDAFDADPRIAITGPFTSAACTKQNVRRAKWCRQYWTDNQIYDFARKLVSKQPAKSWVDMPDVDGFAFFIRRSVWDELGGFHPDLPDYGNETELCKRVLAKGYKIVFVKNSYIHHFGGASIERVMTHAEITERHISTRRFIDNLYGTGTGKS